MDLIYNPTFNLVVLPATKTLLAGESVEYYSGIAVTGWALVGTIGLVTIQASNDGFSSTIYDSGEISVTDTHLLEISTTTAAEWRILAGDGGATVGYLYTGTYENVKAPSYPFSFESNKIADSRQTIGGVVYSVDRYEKRQGSWQMNGIQLAESDTWRGIYLATDGFRKGFVVSPGGITAIITSKGNQLQLSEIAPAVFTLRITAEEII